MLEVSLNDLQKIIEERIFKFNVDNHQELKFWALQASNYGYNVSILNPGRFNRIIGFTIKIEAGIDLRTQIDQELMKAYNNSFDKK